MAIINRQQTLRAMQYPIILRIMGIISLLLIVGAFFSYPRLARSSAVTAFIPLNPVKIIVPPTDFDVKPPEPLRPKVPIPSDEPDIEPDVTIMETELGNFPDLGGLPPLPSEGPKVIFHGWEVDPKPLAPIHPVYPAIAQAAGIEGTVRLNVLIDEKGRVRDVVVIKGVPNTGLDEAAMRAIRDTRFKPAQQRDRPVAVWIEIPINFRLK